MFIEFMCFNSRNLQVVFQFTQNVQHFHTRNSMTTVNRLEVDRPGTFASSNVYKRATPNNEFIMCCDQV